MIDVRPAGRPAAVVEDLDRFIAAARKDLADALLSGGPERPGKFVRGLLSQREDQASELRMLLADVALALRLAAVVLATGAVAGYPGIVDGLLLVFTQFEVHPRFAHTL